MNTFSPLSVNRGAVLIRMSVLFFVVFCFSTSHAKVNKDYSDGVLLYCECNESDNGYIFGLAVTKRVTVPYVEFSLDKDFSRIKYAYQLNAKEDKYYEVEIPSSDIENNTYYWRVADKDKRMIPGDKNGMVTFGTKSVEDYSIKTDPSVYGKMDFGDESELEIESIWLRSELNGNRLEWANAPYCSTKLFPEINSSEYANNHGLVVRGNTIYIARGTFNVSAWNYDKEQVWLDRYDLTTGETLPMLRTLKNYPLHVYDSIPWINERAETADFPLFYRTGTHWSWVLGMEVAADFARYLNEESRFTFPQASVAYQPTEEPVHPDADIFKLLNLFSKPYDEVYFQADFLSEPRTDEGPNLFCRGGSFMEQTISPLIRNGYFKQDTYVQNTMIYRNCFSELTEFSDYAEMDLKQEIDQADIILLEVNEAHIPVMSFSLIDYLLEHPEILSE